MNISPHEQRPTKYPWPGPASALAVVLGVAVVVTIGFMLLAQPATEDEEAAPTGVRVTAAQLM